MRSTNRIRCRTAAVGPDRRGTAAVEFAVCLTMMIPLIVGLWETREDWKRWHDDPAFHDTAERLKGLESDAGTPTWHQVVYAGGRFEA